MSMAPKSKNYELIGVSSFVESPFACAKENHPLVFSRVSKPPSANSFLCYVADAALPTTNGQTIEYTFLLSYFYPV